MSSGVRWDGVARRSLWPAAIGPGRRPALWIGQVDLADFNDRLVAAEQAELPQDLGDVRFGRRLGELQFVGDLPVWVTLARRSSTRSCWGVSSRSFACKAWVLSGFFDRLPPRILGTETEPLRTPSIDNASSASMSISADNRRHQAGASRTTCWSSSLDTMATGRRGWVSRSRRKPENPVASGKDRSSKARSIPVRMRECEARR